MAGFLDFCEDFFAANCANDANGPHRIAHIAVIAGGPFAQFAAQILVGSIDRRYSSQRKPVTFMNQASKGWVLWAIVALLGAASFAATAGDLRLVDAVKNRDRAAVRSLLEQHLNVIAAQPDGTTALPSAANRDDWETQD